MNLNPSTFLQKTSFVLKSLKENFLFRSLEVPFGVDLSSNDYLGLTRHPKLVESLKEGLDLYGAGSGASRLVCGHRNSFEIAEQTCSEWVGTEASLWVANGYAANLGLISCIANAKSEIFTDRLNHASILDGIRLSGAEKTYYKHLNLNHLEELLRKSKKKEKIIISESVFSMDGDFAPILDLLYLKNKYDAVLILDDAHGIGVFGQSGEGRVAQVLGPERMEEVDFITYTGGKSLGLEGAWIGTSRIGKEFLINKMRTFIYSTAPMPAIAHAVPTSISIVRSMKKEREDLLKRADRFRISLEVKNYPKTTSESQIVPILFPSERTVLDSAEICKNNGLYVKAIRPPTVSVPRLRISIHSDTTESVLEKLISLLPEF
ncbi:aminotransferase class I/II-fold pyridoxal phosphate-dependent enzyme [Leptospira weilii]|uniref:aminotransferase class I/II-fold pyridoxal phosphate-dependent enzyme n=1 Tax=Leptospira weilii TaxID=28184 RepID=UPI0002BE4539|nr:aminotransferase class I/II-fold pyridoxal phosphate-dependent enzyme [Leptospira weilii]EMN44948.1 putative 8-amino-7-oxononanoate synthase [Leptospira weilii str. LNT 1234]QDK23498.1 aminotransferase class I/II-fold pyridoxal phosphate-dependent enzyme [Leptospira weilii]QDK26861.1 aminotransferase class I/II-fold pyridoxal phosphate-dependent enzyme [Leptospira weilii]